MRKGRESEWREIGAVVMEERRAVWLDERGSGGERGV